MIILHAGELVLLYNKDEWIDSIAADKSIEFKENELVWDSRLVTYIFPTPIQYNGMEITNYKWVNNIEYKPVRKFWV